MKLDLSLARSLQIIVHLIAIFTSSLSSSSTEHLSQPTFTSEKNVAKCEQVLAEPCASLYISTQLPNLFGQTSVKTASESLNETLASVSLQSKAIISFICTLYLPPCSENSNTALDYGDRNFVILPCRPMCDLAFEELRPLLNGEEPSWPVKCLTLPTEDCFNTVSPDRIAFVKTTITASHIKSLNNNVLNFAPLDVELGEEESYELEVVSPSSSRIPERRYDIANLGDPDFFHGWTDVQGTGAANDYCRVIGKGKRRFLSCNLAGSTGQGHHYVSKLGFDYGHPHTWFMRDMDGDGRDDYCRCVGSMNNSRTTCMKAGENGFYGSPTQGGEQHTFSLSSSGGCFNKRVNPAFGETIV